MISWEHFGPCLRNKRFSQIKGLCWNTANNINFHYRINSVEINDQIFQYIKKNPVFGPFSQFLGQKGHACTISYGFLVVYRKSPLVNFPLVNFHWVNSHLVNFPLANSHPVNSHLVNFHPMNLLANECVIIVLCVHILTCDSTLTS